ncbi:MAG TPA: carboxypeptidase-like regulatory domain-containing protein [Candidatus Angelobacter sp.]|nr:carboxypeptidase-like regulatory domain-containing protein [Candidatus Angelobacter sp.]
MKNQNSSIPGLPENLLQQVRVASPCVADWEKMIGDDKIRHCSECGLSVYNLSSMTVREAAHIISSHQGRLCVRLCRSADGTMITKDYQPVRRASRLAGAALSAAMTVTVAAAQTSPGGAPNQLVQIEQHESGIVVQVVDPTGAGIPNAEIILISPATQKEWKGSTNEIGNLQLNHLPAGTYSIIVRSSGFQKESEVMTLQERQTGKLHMTLQVATIGSVVEVPAAMSMAPTVVVVADAVAIPLEPIADSGEGSFIELPVSTKRHSKSIFSRLWHKLGL